MIPPRPRVLVGARPRPIGRAVLLGLVAATLALLLLAAKSDAAVSPPSYGFSGDTLKVNGWQVSLYVSETKGSKTAYISVTYRKNNPRVSGQSQSHAFSFNSLPAGDVNIDDSSFTASAHPSIHTLKHLGNYGVIDGRLDGLGNVATEKDKCFTTKSRRATLHKVRFHPTLIKPASGVASTAVGTLPQLSLDNWPGSLTYFASKSCPPPPPPKCVDATYTALGVSRFTSDVFYSFSASKFTGVGVGGARAAAVSATASFSYTDPTAATAPATINHNIYGTPIAPADFRADTARLKTASLKATTPGSWLQATGVQYKASGSATKTTNKCGFYAYGSGLLAAGEIKATLINGVVVIKSTDDHNANLSYSFSKAP